MIDLSRPRLNGSYLCLRSVASRVRITGGGREVLRAWGKKYNIVETSNYLPARVCDLMSDFDKDDDMKAVQP